MQRSNLIFHLANYAEDSGVSFKFKSWQESLTGLENRGATHSDPKTEIHLLFRLKTKVNFLPSSKTKANLLPDMKIEVYLLPC